MIVEETFGNFVNIYVDGTVFTANAGERIWTFGDGENSPERLKAEASKRAMTVDTFTGHYHSLCNAAAGWDDSRWAYRYHVVSLDAKGYAWLPELMENAERKMAESGVSRDETRCRDLLKKCVSNAVIRENGLRVQKYIHDTTGQNRSRIVYRMAELTPFAVESLIPKTVLESVIHRQQA